MLKMSFGMEIMIMVALLVYVVTSVVTVGLTVWLIRLYRPFFKVMMKQMKEIYDLYDEEA